MDNLFKILDIAIISGKEDDVTSFSLALLEYSGKTFKNEYIITSQKHILLGTPDICISKLKDSQPLLVIECKARQRSLINSDTQIMDYMKNGKYNNGLLIYPDQTVIYHMEDKKPHLFKVYRNKQYLRELVKYVNSL
jgi:hypothetical protein